MVILHNTINELNITRLYAMKFYKIFLHHFLIQLCKYMGSFHFKI